MESPQQGKRNATIAFDFDRELIREVVTEVVSEVLANIDWPIGRLALSEEEAAKSCGVGRTVLRDLRYAGHLHPKKIGRSFRYTRKLLLEFLEEHKGS